MSHSRVVIPPAVLIHDCFNYLWFFYVFILSWILCFQFLWRMCWSFHEDCSKSVGRLFLLLISSSVSFFSVLKLVFFFLIIPACRVRVITRFFCLDFPFSRFVIHINKNYCFLATLLKVFVSYKSFLVGFLGLFMYTVTSPVHKGALPSSFPIWIPLISLRDLTAPVKTSSTDYIEQVWKERASLFSSWF